MSRTDKRLKRRVFLTGTLGTGMLLGTGMGRSRTVRSGEQAPVSGGRGGGGHHTAAGN